MEAPWKGKITDFGGPEGLRRESEDADRLFYADPRLVGHVDRQASDFLAHEYSRAIPEGARVLDLMSSVESHLPAEGGLEVTGLGLNDEELRSNPLLVERTVHDLNVEAELPFGDDTFDAVVCSLSYEYLTRPVEVAAEVRRVLRAGGVFLVGLSNRWFPPKVTKIWTQLHEFERLGMVLEHLRAAGFEGLRTVTVQNWPRPADDPHYPRIRLSDPVYLASGVKIR